MRIGILGSGDVGKVLASGFVKHGDNVMIGTRNPEKLKEWSEQGGKGITVGGFRETAQFGEILVLAVKGSAAESTLRNIGAGNLEGKMIIDTTNPIADEPPVNGVLKFFTTHDQSLLERLQEMFPKARFVKAFNSIGSAHMVNPVFESKPTMFICGNDEEAKKKVNEIVMLFGFEAEDMGRAEAARAIEPLCMLWCTPGFLRNDWNHAFKLLKK
ncbi:MAG: NAD(P)-binding domain-containing protein [Nanoarchaeota archaeon]